MTGMLGGGEAPLPGRTLSFSGQVERSWIDVNLHMNVSWYDRVFDQAESNFFEVFGFNDEAIRATGFSIFRLEKNIRYEREVMLGKALEVHSTVLWTDLKRVHHFHELWNVEDGYRAAVADNLSIHVDLSIRRSARMTLPETGGALSALAEEHARLAWPKGARRNFKES